MEAEVAEEEASLGIWARLWGGLWAVAALGTVLTYWQGPYFLTLLSAFRFQMWLVLVVLSIPPLFTFPKNRKLLFLAVPLMIMLSFLSYLVPLGRAEESPESLSFVVANVYSGNLDLGRLQAWLEQHPSDIVGILELSSGHDPAIRELGYEHVILEPRRSNFGIGLLCKTAPLKSEILGAETPFPAIYAEFEKFQLIVAHPPPPVSSELREVGDSQVEALLEYSKVSDKPTVFMGDLNATGWDLRVLPLKENGYKDARRGHGILPTWPVGRRLLSIPIDHIFVPEDWTVNSCEVGPEIGSDHFPLRALATPR